MVRIRKEVVVGVSEGNVWTFACTEWRKPVRTVCDRRFPAEYNSVHHHCISLLVNML
jgi:hypothetical protein